ncbi:MAG: hypothetical protein K6E47_04460 [Lachnospiraceae bacterium]|nr:hypothetical protein [Lachnospiraceae bacterium]
MKKARIIALILCVAMLCTILPQKNIKASEDVVAYTATRGVLNSYASYTVTINVIIDRVKKKAKVSLSRTDFGVRDKEYLELEYPDSLKAYEKLEENNYGFFTADVVEDKFDYDQGNLDFRLENFSWETDYFYITGFVGGNGYPGRFININKWRKVNVGGLGNGCVGLGTNDWNGEEPFSFQLVTDYAPVVDDKTDKIFTMGRDNFGFSNSKINFLNGSEADSPKIVGGNSFKNGTYGYMLDNSAYDSMMLGRTPSQMAEINARLSKYWKGSCYGMSITAGLLFEEKIYLNQVGKADKTINLEVPINNADLMRTLTFYQVCTSYDFMNYEKRHLQFETSSGMVLNVVKSLKEHPENPVVLCFSFYRGSGNSRKGYAHAVLAFKVEEKKGDYYKYDISIYDPNNPNNEDHLYVTETGDCYFKSGEYGNNLDIRTADKAKELYDITLKYPEVEFDKVEIHTNGDIDFTVGKEKYTVKGDIVTGKSDIIVRELYGSDEIVIIVPIKKGQSIRVKRKSGTYASIQKNDEFVVISNGVNDVTVNSKGKVTAKTNGSEGTVAVASDKNKGKLFGTTVKSDAGKITITPGTTGSTVKTDKGDSDITVSGKNESITFEGADTTKGAKTKSSGTTAKITIDGKQEGKGKATLKGNVVKIGNSSGNDIPTNPDVKIKEDNDITGYTPEDWSWKGNTGTNTKYFIPGKYVREDGMAVIYIKPTKSKTKITYQLFELPIEAKQSSFKTMNWETGSSYVEAEIKTTSTAQDIMNGIYFKCYKNGSIKITTDWIDEMYYQYDGLDGTYYLVKEVK